MDLRDVSTIADDAGRPAESDLTGELSAPSFPAEKLAVTGKPLGEPIRRVNSTSLSPDSTRIVITSDDHIAQVWDAATAKPQGGPMRHEAPVSNAGYCPDGTRIVTAGADARVWDAVTVPLARLMSAQFEENHQRATFLRGYDLKRLPDDPALWERVVRSLHEQKDDERARQALQKLEKLAPEKAAALRKELAF